VKYAVISRKRGKQRGQDMMPKPNPGRLFFPGGEEAAEKFARELTARTGDQHRAYFANGRGWRVRNIETGESVIRKTFVEE
jgi:hypothetical protein